MVFNFFKSKTKTKAQDLGVEQSLQNKVDALLRTEKWGTPRTEGHVGSPVGHIVNPPFKPIEIWVKQIKWDSLTLIGRAALDTAFSGFSDGKQNQDELASYKKMMASRGINIEVGPVGMALRYAGDHTLPKGAYYSLCDESGNDERTLVGELRAYYMPKSVGVVQIFDCTLLGDLTALQPIANANQLIFKFLPISGIDNPFITTFADLIGEPEFKETLSSKSISIGLPLKITKISRNNVLDLRDPEAANWFVRTLTSLTWQLEENGVIPTIKNGQIKKREIV